MNFHDYFKRSFLSFLFVFVLSSQGCAIFVPFIDSYKSIGVQRSDREQLLDAQVKEFSRARFWGKKVNAMKFVRTDSRRNVQDFLLSQKPEKIVESEVEFVDFLKDAYEAEVSARVKYYRVPYYIVEERIESQQWAFSLSDGWKLQSIKIRE